MDRKDYKISVLKNKIQVLEHKNKKMKYTIDKLENELEFYKNQEVDTYEEWLNEK